MILTSFPRILEIHSRREHTARADRVLHQVGSIDEAMDLLRSHGGDSRFNARLREQFASDLYLHATLSCDALYRHVAARLASGELVLLRHTPCAGGTYQAGALSAVPAPVAAAPVRAPVAASARAQAAAQAVVAPEASIYDNANQNAQAATLVKAAVAGTPFCEICERKKQEREAAAVPA